MLAVLTSAAMTVVILLDNGVKRIICMGGLSGLATYGLIKIMLG